VPDLRAVAISGSPRAPSKSKTLAELMLRALASEGCATEIIDLAELPAEALVARAPAPQLDAAIAAVGAANIVIAASPTYRALYTGVMKCFFDLMPPAHLAKKICVPVQTAASPAHFLAVAYGFGPLFASLDGIAIAGVYATDAQFAGDGPDPALLARIAVVSAAAVSLARGSAG
jgi:FMN reductase